MAARKTSKDKNPSDAVGEVTAAAPKASQAPDGLELLTAHYEDPASHQVLTRELGKQVLSKGSWATVCFLVQDLDKQTGRFGAPKISIRRYKKQGGAYRYHSHFQVSSMQQALDLAAVIHGWFGPEGTGSKAQAEAGGDAASVEE